MIILQKATIEDAHILFEWRNDDEVRKRSFNSNKVSYEEHLKWFMNKLYSSNTKIYIVKDNKTPIGVIRLDDKGKNNKIISFSIDKEHRNKGHASKLLKLIKVEFKEYNLIGKVKYNNMGSIKAFQNAQYFMEEKADYLEFYSKAFKNEKYENNEYVKQ